MELPLPIYLQFLIELVPQLGGRDRIAAAKEEDTEGEIRARWRPELPSPSQNLLGAMATICDLQRRNEAGQSRCASQWMAHPVKGGTVSPPQRWKGETVQPYQGRCRRKRDVAAHVP